MKKTAILNPKDPKPKKEQEEEFLFPELHNTLDQICYGSDTECPKLPKEDPHP